MTRTSEVRPELFLGTFRCMDCGTIARNVEQQFKFTQPLMCKGTMCGNRRGAPEAALLFNSCDMFTTFLMLLHHRAFVLRREDARLRAEHL